MLRRQFPVARRGVAICFAALAVLTGVAPEAARADIIAQNTGEVDSGTTVPGQSVTTPLGGPWDAITFNFFTNPTTPTASGTLFLLSKEYLGTPAALSSATSGFVAQSQSISGGKYIFDPGVTLQPNTQYFLYANASFLNSGGTHALYPGGNLYFANSAGANFGSFANLDANFRLEGTVVQAVPEPTSLALLAVGGLGLLGYARRQKARAA